VATDLQKKWEERIRRAKKIKAEWEDQFQVRMCRDYFEGKQNPGYPEEEWITINKVYSHLMAQLPTLYSMDPYFYVKLKKSFHVTPETIAQWDFKGKKRQAMLNYLKGELDMKSHARLAIQDAHFAFGVLKTRRASDEEDHPHAGEPILDEQGNELKDEETGETLVYPDKRPVNERYELDRVHPDDILFGENSGPLEKSWDWIGQHICMSKEEALADPRFNKRVINAIKGKRRDPVDDPKQERRGLVERLASAKNPDEVFLDFWEIYDLKKNEWLMLVEDGEDLAIKPRTVPAGIEKHPFAILRFTLRDNSPYPIPPVFAGLGPQKEYNLSRSRLLTHRKRFNRKYEVDVTKLEDADAEIAKLEVGADGTIIRKVGGGQAVDPIQDAPLDQQSIQELLMLNADLVELLGSPDNSRGIASADSATEAGLLDRRLEIKEGDRMSLVVDWIIACAKKLDQLIKVHIDRDEAVRVTGPEGEAWVTVSPKDYSEIEGEYEYSVNVGASRPRLPDIERSQWIAFLSQVVVPFPHILTAPNIMKRMAEMFHIEDEAALEEFRQLGESIMQGQMPFPGQTGGGPPGNPVSAALGAALGQMGGNANGGGAATVQ
jgi:hypothetical protein